MKQGKTDNRPFFSVILPVYNRARLIARALQSLRSQQWKQWDCWIIDDGSTDDTAAVVQQWMKIDDRFHLLQHRENRGAAAARNTALPYVRGKFITFLDADDWYLPDHLWIRWEFIRRFPTVPWFYGGVRILGDPYVPDVNCPSCRIHLQHCIIGATFVIHRSVFLQTGGFPDVRYGEDYQWFVRHCHRWKILYVPHPTYVYDRTTTDSVCARWFSSGSAKGIC